MASKKGSSSGTSKGTVASPEPALSKSRIVSDDGLKKLRPVVATKTNEGGATVIRPGSTARSSLGSTDYAFFYHTIFAGLVPPFSKFLCAILVHYKIHLLHLQPNSIVILAMFAFLCEAFLGVEPSVELFRHFYSLRVTAGEQRSGCVSFRIGDGMASCIIPLVVTKKVEDFRKRWIFMDAREASPHLQIPTGPAVKGSGWEQVKPSGEVLAPLVERMRFLREGGFDEG